MFDIVLRNRIISTAKYCGCFTNQASWRVAVLIAGLRYSERALVSHIFFRGPSSLLFHCPRMFHGTFKRCPTPTHPENIPRKFV